MKKLIGIITIVLLIVLFLIVLFIRQSTSPSQNTARFPIPTPIKVTYPFPTRAPLPQIATGENNSLGSVVLTINESPSIPSSVPVYKLADTQVPEETVTSFMNLFNFSGNPEQTPDANNTVSLHWQKENEELVINQRYGLISYMNYSSNPAGTINSETDAINLATNFLAHKGLIAPEQKNPTISLFRQTPENLETVTSFAEADSFIVSFPFLLDNLTVYQQFGGITGTHVTINKSGAIEKVLVQYPLTVDKKNYQPLSLTEAEQKIQNGQGSVVSYAERASGLPVNSKPQQTTFTRVSLELFEDKLGGFIEPIYVFEGLSTTNNQSYKILVYVSAIAN